MNTGKEKTPSTAATMQGRDNNVQEQYNTANQERQEGFRMAGALESLATEIEQTRQLVGLLVDRERFEQMWLIKKSHGIAS